MLTYSTPLLGTPEDIALLVAILEEQRLLVNSASKVEFNKDVHSITKLHKEYYYWAKKSFPNAPSQVIIKAEQESLATYKQMRSNKKPAKRPFEKRNLSMRLDKRLFSLVAGDKSVIKITTHEGRKLFRFYLYRRLKELLDKPFSDPLLFVRNGTPMISLSFDVVPKPQKKGLCLGVDLGIRRVAACSDGRIFIDREFNREKRKLRYLKRQLQGKGTKSARKHRKKLLGKEGNRNKNQSHLIANAILKTDASCIAIENLKGIKTKKHKRQNKNAISQVPMFDLRRIIEYKAMHQGKSVCLVSPAWTSQTDSASGLREGERRGCRFYATNGLVYDADLNAACNIARRSKLPFSQGNLLDGQGEVNRPIACQSSEKGHCKPMALKANGG